MNNNVYYVPIGNNCRVAWYLQSVGLRNCAFPFDWSVSPIESVFEIIKTDFKNFFDLNNFIFLPSTKRFLFENDEDEPKLVDDVITPVYDQKFHILYVHDFSEKGKKEYEEVKRKYQRRVERLQKILKNKKNKIIFIYDNSDINQWQESQYLKVNYNFKKLDDDRIKNMAFDKYNVRIISLESFKKEMNR